MVIDKHAARRAFSARQVLVSLKIATVVGTILNLINQGDALLGLAHLDFFKALLTYFVPFAVATYSAYRAYAAQDTR